MTEIEPALKRQKLDNEQDMFEPSKKRKTTQLTKPLEKPFFKGIQLPEHLKWVTVNAKANASVLI